MGGGERPRMSMRRRRTPRARTRGALGARAASIALWLTLAPAGACSALVDHALDSKPRGTGGAGASAGNCDDVVDCPAPSNECLERACLAQTCATLAVPAGHGCAGGAGECDGLGSCVQHDGTPCVVGAQCHSNQCVEDTCCHSACDGPCQTCRAPASSGQCTPLPAGSDPLGACAGGTCDGSGNCALGEHHFSQVFGDAADGQAGLSIALDSTGAISLGGRYEGSLPIVPGQPLADGGGGSNAFVARLAPNGTPVWSVGFGGPDDEAATGLGVTSGGDVRVAGFAKSSFDFGGTLLVPAGGADVWVGALSNGGVPAWGGLAGDADEQYVATATVAPDGSLLVGGGFRGGLNLGGPPLAALVTDGFVAKIDAAGDLVWARALGDPVGALVSAVASDASGNVLVTGRFEATLVFGATTLSAQGGRDVFVAKLAPDGQPLWAFAFGDGALQEGRAIASGPGGTVIVAGDNEGSVDFGAGSLDSNGASDVFVALFAGDGSALWSHGYGGSGVESAEGVAFEATTSAVLVVGAFEASVDFGRGPLTSAGASDAFVVKLAADGATLWSHAFGSAAPDAAHAVAVANDGSAVVTGEIGGTVDFGGGPRANAGGSDVFVLGLGP